MSASLTAPIHSPQLSRDSRPGAVSHAAQANAAQANAAQAKAEQPHSHAVTYGTTTQRRSEAPQAKPQLPHTWATRLLSNEVPATNAEIARRIGAGLGLSALYGVALGARVGAKSLFQHAAGVPLGLILVAILGAPSVFVFLSICRAPIDARAIAGSVSRSIASAGILLAGLAPAAALFVVSSETANAASGMVVTGLLLGGGVALGRMLLDVLRQAAAGGAESVLGALVVAGGFGLFAIALASRVWGALLPILGSAT